MGKQDVQLMAHLLRRAGFGATRQEIEQYVHKGFQETVEELLNPSETSWIGDFLVRRFDLEASGTINAPGAARSWIYQMVTTTAPLQEKMTLFWHSVFATGVPKVINGRVLKDQISMFRKFGLTKLDTMLLELSRDPAMIVWLDNQDNHNGAINENWGRELLELFSMGVGSYSEEDIKECARAFTGWSIANTEYMMVRSKRDSDWPYGRIAYHYEYKPEDHDEGDKTFLGHTGNFNGGDIIEIICRQPSTAKFIARHLYHFFVADEPPVPSWPYIPPRDPKAIDALVKSYYDSDFDIREMLRVLFNSNFFKASDAQYQKVKSPAEFVVSILKMTKEFETPKREMLMTYNQIGWMGQNLLNPPSVEGWHQGTEWLDTGTLIERLNFASEQFGDINKPGVKAIVKSVIENSTDQDDAEGLVDQCLDQMGAITVSEQTRDILLNHARQGDRTEEDLTQLLRLTAASKEFQRA